MGITPKALLERPEIDDEMHGYLDQYGILDRARNMTMGLAPITLAEIKAYLDLAGVHGVSERMKFVRIAQAIDGASLEAYAKKQTAAGKQS